MNTDRQVISSTVVRNAINRRFPRTFRAAKVIRDTEYTVFTRQEIMAAVMQSEEIGSVYVVHKHDCDDMADGCMVDVKRQCPGAPFGTLMYSYWQNGKGAIHVVCFFYDPDSRRIVIIEPADGSVHRLPSNYRLLETRL